MSDSNSQGSSKGIGFSELLTILFISLKAIVADGRYN